MRKHLAAFALALFAATASAQTRTLSDVARERNLGIRPPGSGTFSVAGASGMPVLAPMPIEEPEPAAREALTSEGSWVPYPVFIGGQTVYRDRWVSHERTHAAPHGHGTTPAPVAVAPPGRSAGRTVAAPAPRSTGGGGRRKR